MRTSPSFPHLRSPLVLGKHTLRNRMIFGAHRSALTDEAGLPTRRYADYLLARARGGVGCIIAEGGIVVANSLRQHNVPRAFQPEMVERWAPIVRELKAEGTVLLGQLFHAGRQATAYANYDLPLWAPSAIACPAFREIPKAMDKGDLATLIDGYARSARNLKDAGFDGVEVQACHGYLLNEFLSPYTNKREDEYGGSLENRMRLLMEVLAVVREAVGPDLLVGVRHEVREMVPGGLELEESWLIARELERWGRLDFLNFSQGVRETQEQIRAPMFTPPGYALDDAAAIKRELSIPCFSVGRINHPAVAERALAEGKADAVVLVRQLIADPDFPRKALGGAVDDIRFCLGAGDCVYNVASGYPLTCAQNAEVGREGRGALAPAARPGKLVVVGGGPAGMEAARVAAIKGHRVVLFERSRQLGGALRLATRSPGREELGGVVDFLERQLEKLGVEVRLGEAPTAAQLRALEPDWVLLALGAAPLLPPSPLLPPLQLEPGAQLIGYEEVFQRQWRAGERVALIDGEYFALGMGVADYLAERGVKVAFVTPAERPGLRLDGGTQKVWFKRLLTRGVTLHPFTALAGASEEGARVRSVYTGEQQLLPCDVVVYAHTRLARGELYDELRALGVDARRIGDCLAPRSMPFAIHDGYDAAAAL